MNKPSKAGAVPRARDKRVWARVERDAQTVTEEVFAEAKRRDPRQRRPWVTRFDSQPQPIAQIEQTAAAQGVALTLVLDVIHVLEYLWKAAYCFHASGTEAAEAWVQQRALWLLEGKSNEVAAGMRRSATLQGLKRKARAAVELCATYLLNHRAMLRYDVYLIKDRMDSTGAPWGLQTAEAILKLRSLKASGDLDEYWQFHLQRERERQYEGYDNIKRAA